MPAEKPPTIRAPVPGLHDPIYRFDRKEFDLGSAFKQSSWIRPGATLCVKDAQPPKIHFVQEGICAGYELFVDGRRQIISLYVPGDLINSESLYSRRTGRDVVAMGHARVRSATLGDVEAAAENDTDLREALIHDIAQRHSILEAWVSALGRKTAMERMASLFCELVWRLAPSDQRERPSCAVPFNQSDLADILGISVVHANRVLRALKEARLVTFDGGHIEIQDLAALVDVAHFDPSYLI